MKKEELKLIPNCPGIYCIENIKNKKCYIGQSIKLRNRLYEHFRVKKDSKCSEYPLYKDIRKYGISYFSVTILEKITEDINITELSIKLDELEIYYIDKYNSFNNGYNQTKGGKQGYPGHSNEVKNKIREAALKQARDGRNTIYCLDIITKEINKYTNSIVASEKLNLCSGSIRSAKRKKEVILNYYFTSNLDELLNIDLDESSLKNNKYNIHSIFQNNYLIEYYNELCTLEDTKINSIAKYFNLTRDTINKRNKKLRNLGYVLPIQSKNKIDYIELIDTVNNSVEKVQIEDISNKFSISIESARKQIRRNSLYKKQYKFNIVYV